MDLSGLNCANDVVLAADPKAQLEEQPRAPPAAPAILQPKVAGGSNVTPLLTPGRGLTAPDLRTQIAFADGLAEQVAILDRGWSFLAANQAWTRAMSDRLTPGLSPGENYLEHLLELAREGDEEARAVAEALTRIDSGEISSFEYLEPSDREGTGRVYKMRIYPCSTPSRQWRVVVRYDVTELLDLKKQTHLFGDQLLNAEAEERRRVARDLHDTTAQDLVALQLSLANLKRKRRAPVGEDFADADEALERLQREIRSISYLFHSPLLHEPGLSKGLEAMAKGFGKRTGLNVSLWLDDLDSVDPRLSLMIHRLTQEALANVHRHARATEVEIRLIVTERRIHVMVRDNGIGLGKGCDGAVGVGLRSMRERAEDLGGFLQLKSGPGGTSVIASLPYRAEEVIRPASAPAGI
ncbi:MAG TPA: sensor histidine kinase [Allosphingosinicella sp.]